MYEWQDSNLRKILWFPKPAFYQLNYTHISIGFFQGCRSNPSATPRRYHPDVVRELKLHTRSPWIRKWESFSHHADDLLSHTSNGQVLIKLHPLLLVGATSLSVGFIWPRAQANPQDWYQSCNCRLGLAGRAVPGLVFLVSVDTCGIRTPPSPCKGEVLPLHYMAHRCPVTKGRIVSCFGYLPNPSCDLGRIRTGTGFLPSAPQADAYCQFRHKAIYSRGLGRTRTSDLLIMSQII